MNVLLAARHGDGERIPDQTNADPLARGVNPGYHGFVGLLRRGRSSRGLVFRSKALLDTSARLEMRTLTNSTSSIQKQDHFRPTKARSVWRSRRESRGAGESGAGLKACFDPGAKSRAG